MVCLNMIVRNEAKIIERCLTSALPLIDCWTICDTGSTDGTPELIKAFFKKHDKPGFVCKAPFENFAQARNKAMEFAEGAKDLNFQYLLLIDADMEIHGTLDKMSLDAPAYKIKQTHTSGDLSYYNTRLIKRSLGTHYVGATHEFISVPNGQLLSLDSLQISDHGDGGSKANKYERDIGLLRGALENNPRDERAMFYLAETLRNSGSPAEAILWYTRRMDIGGWDEEVWYASYAKALCYKDLNDAPNFINSIFESYNLRPSRAEPLYHLTKWYREHGKNAVAAAICDIGRRIPNPTTDTLFIEDSVYNWGFQEEISIVGFYGDPKRRTDGYAACASLTLSHANGPRQLALRNFVHYAQASTELFKATIKDIKFAPNNGWNPMNPSIFIDDDGARLSIVRTVNYDINEKSEYVTRDGSDVIRTQNYLVRFNNEWEITRHWAIEEDKLPRTEFAVKGYEDCRLFKVKDTFYCSATVRNMTDNPSGRCEIAILELDKKWRVVNVDVARDYNNDKQQKNWMPVLGMPKPTFIYSTDQTTVIERDKITIEIFLTDPPACLDDMRGGSQVVKTSEGWLCLTHSVAWTPNRVYLHRFILLDKQFRVTKVSDLFYFIHKGIEFCAGLAKDGNTLVASFGVHDKSAHLAIFEEDKVLSKLRAI